jgi:putative MATE family efflux protein
MTRRVPTSSKPGGRRAADGSRGTDAADPTGLRASGPDDLGPARRAPRPAGGDGRHEGGDTWRRALALAGPAVGLQSLILVVSLTGRWLAGNAETASAAEQLALQGAQTTCFYLSWMIASFGVLASAGATALVARLIGAGDREAANRTMHQALLVAAVVAVGGWLLGGFGIDHLLDGLNLDGAAAGHARLFLQAMLLLLPCQLFSTTLTAALAGAGDTSTALKIGVGTTAANLPLSWIAFRGVGDWPGLGLAGIAWGAGLSQALGLIALVALLTRGRSGLRLHPRLLRPDRRLLSRLLRISLPAAAESLSMVAGQMVFLSVVNRLGDAARGAHGIALGWEALAEMFGMAFGVAASVLVGQNLGAGRPDEARRSGVVAYACGTALMTLCGAVFYTFATPLFELYCPRPEQAPVVAAGVPVLRLVAFAMPAVAACHIFSSGLRGAGDTRSALLVTTVGFFAVRLPVTFLACEPAVHLPGGRTLPGLGLGLYGCWIGMQADLWFRGGLFAWRFIRGGWDRTRV